MILLDTFPSTRLDAGLYAGGDEWQEIAIPFSVPTAGTITNIKTGLNLVEMMCGMNLSVSGPSSHSVYINHHSDFPLWGCPATPPLLVDRFELIELDGLDWHVEPGAYVLKAEFTHDLSFAIWETNPTLTGSWLVRKTGVDESFIPGWAESCSPFAGLWSSCGLASMPTPAARITFEAPEPQLFLAALFTVLLLVWRRR